MKSVFAVLLTAATCSPTLRPDDSAAGLFARAVPICALLADPEPFVGKVVNVSGVLVLTPHGGVFEDDGCDRGEMPVARANFEADNERALAIRDASWRANRRARVPVVMSGTLKDNFNGNTPGFRCSAGGICQRYSLESDSLVAALPPTR